MICLGIDPGCDNLGYAIADAGRILSYGYMDPNLHDPHEFLDLFCQKTVLAHEVDVVLMERFVPYAGKQGVDTAETTNILIGMLLARLRGPRVAMMRAGDWKIQVAKRLARERNFENPSGSLDKKFSKAAAKCILPGYKGSTHEADGICMAWLGSLM